MITHRTDYIFYSFIAAGLAAAIFMVTCVLDVIYFFMIPNISFSQITIEDFFDCTNVLKGIIPILDNEVKGVQPEKNESSDIIHTKLVEKEPEYKSIPSANLQITNQTDYKVDMESMLREIPEIDFSKNEIPQILIVHTHASESYSNDRDYELTDTDRTQDLRYNMVRVGEELYKELSLRGYNVIHDKTIHDYPSYTSSYKRCSDTITEYLQKYPSICAVFDIHRDAISDSDGNRMGLVGYVGEEECAQVMIVCGTDKNNLEFDLWEENLRFAVKIQKYMEDKYPGLMRPINLRKERFNLHLTRGSLLFEIGTNGNSLKQAVNSMKYLADGIDNVCKSLKNKQGLNIS